MPVYRRWRIFSRFFIVFKRQTDNKKQILFAKKFYPTEIFDFGTPIRKIIVCLSRIFIHHRWTNGFVYCIVSTGLRFILSKQIDKLINIIVRFKASHLVYVNVRLAQAIINPIDDCVLDKREIFLSFQRMQEMLGLDSTI